MTIGSRGLKFWVRALRVPALAIVASSLGVGLATAQQSPPQRTAQLSFIQGSVSLEPAGTQQWVAADLNRPLTVSDKLWSDQDSRAELDIGDAVIRLGSMTGVSFLNLDQFTAQLQVTAGTVIVHVRSLGSGEQDEIDTPNLALSLQQPGTYRVEVNQSGDTTIVKVDSGEAVASGDGQTFPVDAQQSVTFTGTTALTADYAMLGAPDDFDDWSMARDRQEEAAAAATDQYVSPQVVGADDLANYGDWQYTQWGYAWFPIVQAGWAPYTLGDWVWISPWGWTWVADEPWGFAPFHYGRWGSWGGRWCWVPGPRTVRPIYAPALVAFTRGRDGARPTVGWMPLGPRDAYIPSYAASRAYVRNINIADSAHVNTAAIDDYYSGRALPVHYSNSSVAGAVTVVPRSVFTTAQTVAPHRIGPDRIAMSHTVFTSEAPATPVAASVLGPRAHPAAVPPPRLIDRPVVARLAPSRAPVPFAAQQTAIRTNGGRPLTLTQWSRLRPNSPAVAVRLAGEQVRPMSGTARELSSEPARRDDRPPWAQSERGDVRVPPAQSFYPRSSSGFDTGRSAEIRHPPVASPSVRPQRSAPRAPSGRASSVPAQERAPPPNRQPPRAQVESDSGADMAQWSTAPMYEAQPEPGEISTERRTEFTGTAYSPPATPPPMYRPLGAGGLGESMPHRSFVFRPPTQARLGHAAPDFARMPQERTPPSPHRR